MTFRLLITATAIALPLLAAPIAEAKKNSPPDTSENFKVAAGGYDKPAASADAADLNLRASAPTATQRPLQTQ